MSIEFKNGIRVTSRQHELSPLESAIERYSSQAKSYFAKEKTLDTSLTTKEREMKLAEALKHLEHERRLVETIVSVQTQLEHYRDEGRKNKTDDANSKLMAERHHPTKTLAKFMRASGKPQPSKNHSPHHIVAGKGKTRLNAIARLKLHEYGVRINDPDNGVWLVRKSADVPHWSMPNSVGHLCYHTHAYERWILNYIQPHVGEQAIRHRLNLAGRMLQQGALNHLVKKK